MISRDLARKFIEQVTQYTEFNVNIMDGDGTIIASRDPDRGYKTQTMNTLIMGIAAIIEIAILSLVLH